MVFWERCDQDGFAFGEALVLLAGFEFINVIPLKMVDYTCPALVFGARMPVQAPATFRVYSQAEGARRRALVSARLSSCSFLSPIAPRKSSPALARSAVGRCSSD